MTASKREARPELALPNNCFRMLPTDESDTQVSRTGGRNRAGLLSNVALISRGEALGHDMWIDDDTLLQVADLANQSNKGVKSRFTHPGMSSDGLGRHLGRVTDADIVDGRVVGDLHFAKSAHDTPDGNLANYVLGLAEEDPAAAGLSIVFSHDRDAEDAFTSAHTNDRGEFLSPDPDNVDNLPHVRVEALRAADVVDEPAANPDGLFDRVDLPRQADAFLSFVAGLTDEQPNSLCGVDPLRASAFFTRWLADHNLTLSELTAMTTNSPTPEAPAVDTREDVIAELSRFTEAFGAENGAKWFAEGKTFSDCLLADNERLRSEADELRETIAELEGKLAAIDLGEDTPVDVSPEPPKEKVSPFRFVDPVNNN